MGLVAKSTKQSKLDFSQSGRGESNPHVELVNERIAYGTLVSISNKRELIPHQFLIIGVGGSANNLNS